MEVLLYRQEKQKMNILLAEDHIVVRKGLRMLLETDKNIKIVAEAVNGQQVLDLLEKDGQVDMILADINMPFMDGISLTKALQCRQPRVKVVMLSMHAEERYVFESFRARACGYLLKSARSEELLYAINHVYSGGHYLCSTLSMAMLRKNLEGSREPKSISLPDIELSSREVEILQLISEGCTNQQMSDKLFISKRTVEGHRQSLIDKSGARNTAGLIRFAMRKGLIQ